MDSNKRVVISGTVYNLLLNLLIIPEEVLDETLFFTCETIPQTVRVKLKREIFIPDMHHIGRCRRYYYFLKYRLFQKIFCPELDTSSIYAQDHLPFMGMINGNRKYILTEDAPNIFKVNEKQKYVKDSWAIYQRRNSLSWRSKLLNPIMGGIYANNEICEEIIISKKTSTYIPAYVKEKKIKVLDMQESWSNASESKKQYILNVFNISKDDIEMLKSRKVVVFTQPFFEDKDVSSIDEHIEVYKKVMEKYDLNDVVIKTHPRETTDYQLYFPEVRVFNKPVPFQLLDLLGLRFEEAATVCSTAPLSIPYPIKINWFGAKVHPSILAAYGDFIPEQLKNK